MTAATSRLRRRGIGAGVAALVGLSTIGFSASSAFAAPGFELERVGGADRFETAALAAANFEDTTSVVLANGFSNVDALAAASLGQPILLTRDNLTPQATLDALEDLGVENITIVGGTGVVNAAQETALRTAGYTVTRLEGTDRYATAADIAAEADATAPYVFIASGLGVADALAASSAAAATGSPILLVRSGDVPAATETALERFPNSRVVVLGGTGVVSAAVATEVGAEAADRASGANRFETAANFATWALQNDVFDGTTAGIARGIGTGSLGANDLADALVAGPVLGAAGGPLLLAQSATDLGAATTAWFAANADTLNAPGVVFGGEGVISANTVAAAEEAAEGGDDAGLNTIAVAPAVAASLEAVVEANGAANVTADDRAYTVTGLTDTTQYRITLVNAANITTVNGQTRFAIDTTAGQQASGNYLALAGVGGVAPSTTFRSVNGGTPNNDNGANGSAPNTAIANPVNGSLTFVIEGNAPETVVPVVYINGSAGQANSAGGVSPRLELDANGAPVESFGLGGVTTYTAAEAEAGANGSNTAALPITSVDKTGNSFNATVGGSTGSARAFFFDANDTFQIAGAPATLAQFTAELSAGDSVAVNYGTDPGAVSTFNLTNSNPPAITVAAAQAGTTGAATDDVTVTVTFTAPAQIDAINIERAPVTGTTVGTYASVGTITPTAAQLATGGGSATFADNNLAAGTYRYRATAVNDGDAGTPAVTTTDAVTTAPQPDTAGPVPSATALTRDAGFAGILDAGDTFTVQVNEALALPTAGSVIRVADGTAAGSSVADLVVGTNASVSLNAAAIPTSPANTPNAGAPANTVLTVTVTAAPTVVTAGDVAGVAYPATITNTSGVNDVAGNRLNLTAGTGVDVTINAPA
ncbi:cell wall-binding repeat-containing protein [Kineococcus indalonis]|uniref:cell wall-binding repeat-containing protein n=1 Tax=Kineococcus indalonis TaxID=2696566 RepID=UPI001412F956|nr:cell wall-binding repeat-containing protein [Kineococcus indalonis]NAZ87210.1 hypothetical protein [Kineococcus indalonis]